MDEAGRWPAADVDGMVRPYVLSGNGPWLPPRSDRYDDDPYAPYPPASIGQPGWPDWPEDPAQPEPAGPELGGPLSALDDRALADWSRALRRRPRQPAVAGIAAGIIAIACAFIAFLPATRTGRCAGRPCHAMAAGLSGLVPGAPKLTPERPAATKPRLAAPQPRSTAPPGGITVSYRMTKFRDGGFQGEFTIVNGGTVPVDGWQLIVTLPGDHILAAWGAGFQAHGDTVILTPRSHRAIIGPGTSLAVHVIASGADAAPQSCTFNGAPCI